MDLFLAQFLTVVIVHLLALISPGPDFVVVSKNSLSHSRKIGIYTALGVALGISVHVSYSLLGIGLIISKSIVLFNAIKLLGALYLLYIGYKMIRSKPAQENLETASEKPKKSLSVLGAIKNGFLVNALNPKATLFFLALFTQVIDPMTPSYIKLLYGLEMMLMTFIWFIIVSYLFSHTVLRTKLSKAQHAVDKCTGFVLILLGLKVMVSSR
ncbi:MAG: LysE family transporter [bacterium]|nr:LysE family transporter [bacterium]